MGLWHHHVCMPVSPLSFLYQFINFHETRWSSVPLEIISYWCNSSENLWSENTGTIVGAGSIGFRNLQCIKSLETVLILVSYRTSYLMAITNESFKLGTWNSVPIGHKHMHKTYDFMLKLHTLWYVQLWG